MSKRKIDNEAYRFTIAQEDLTFDLRPDQTLFHLMGIICNEWLDDARDGDGGVYDHMWIVSTGYKKYTAPFNDRGEEHEGETKLKDLSISPGDQLNIQYDMGSTTYFSIKFESIENVPANIKLPRLVVKQSDENVAKYIPPEGSPNLNEVFPHANKLLFGHVAHWIIPYPCGKDCGGCVEAGPNAMGDLVFMPHKFENLKEALVAFNEAGKHMPDESTRSDAFSRMTFPRTMPNAQEEEKYNLFKDEYDKFEQYCVDHGLDACIPLSAMAGHPESVMWRLMGPKEVVVRVSDENMAAVEGVDVDKAFPRCARAYLDTKNFWISYRHGKMMIIKGYGSGERGIPRQGSIVATANKKVQSLHEFFCVAEALLEGAV